MSLSLGILLLSRITETFGVAIEGTAGTAHAFPRPEDLAGLEPTAFRKQWQRVHPSLIRMRAIEIGSSLSLEQ